MKLSTSLVLFITLVNAHGKETAPSGTCITKVDCKVNEATKSSDAAKKIEQCASATSENDILKCTFNAIGLKPEQSDSLVKLTSSMKPCTPTADPNLTSCIEKCTGDNKEECSQKCVEPMIVDFAKCVKNLANLPNYDFQEALQCSSKCNQETIAEVYDCDYKCNKSLYDALIAKSGDSSEKDGKPSSNDTKPETKPGNDGKDPKAGNGTQSGTSGKNGAMNGFGYSAFTSISVATLLFLFSI